MSSILALLFLLLTVASSGATSRRSFRVAVFEHARQDNGTAGIIIQTNLGFFREAARIAKSKDADMIVYPEYGIFPPGSREHLKKFLEHIPDPKEHEANPCLESETFSDRPILHALSCIARQNDIVVVANTGDIKACEEESNCPEDGSLHHNTNVAFDRDGTLVGRYHKERLFFEAGMDLPRKPQDPTFKTDLGSFGMFVCFDSVFKKISEIAQRPDIDAILLPTMWIDPAPLMTSVQFWQSWAMGNNATFIVANIQMPGYSAVGSGIFNGLEGSLAYTFNPDGISKLIVASIQGSDSESEQVSVNPTITAITANGSTDYTNDGEDVPNECSKKILGQPVDVYKDYRCLEENTSNYTFIKLSEPEGYVEACNNGMCCSLNYSTNGINENLYFGVHNGTYNMFNRYFWCEENCLLLRCEDMDGRPCATFPLESNTTFLHIYLTANFTTKFVYPSVVDSGMRLVPLSEWTYDVHQGKEYQSEINFESDSGEKLLVAGLNGRCFDRDPPYIR